MKAWHDRAPELARWSMWRLVNRHDAWGRYGDTGTFTAPRVSLRGKVFLNFDDVVRHFQATGRDDVIGSHSTSIENGCRWVAADIDRHSDSTDPATTLRAARFWYDRLAQLGFRPLLTSSNGTGGYHLRVLFREPIPSPAAFTFVRWLTRDHERHGLPAVECFPKQALLKPGGYGNWLRLPGKHHKRDFWCELWAGYRWLAGEEAVEQLLTYRGDNPNLIPRQAEPVEAPPKRPRPVLNAVPGSLDERIVRYMGKLPQRGEGEGRDDVGYCFACFLTRDLALSDDVARPWLERWNDANHPPKDAAELGKWLSSARKYGKRAIGCGLEGAAR